jgi:hypothetical protein
MPYIFDMDHNLAAPARTTGLPHFYDQAAVDDDGKEVPMPLRFARMNACLQAAVANEKVRTIVLDSFTTLTDILIAEVRRQDPKIANPLTPLRIQDWGTFSYLFKEIIMRLRHTGKYLICTSHQKVEKDESDKSFKTFLNIPGAQANYISGLFTDVWLPFPHITGMGGAQQHKWMVRCLPISENDHRGIKSSFGFKVTEEYDKVANTLKSLP